MNLYIRADAGSKIGIGHVMRCIALAQAWQDQGGGVTFISHCETEQLRQKIKHEGFHLIPVERAFPDSVDLESTLQILKKIQKFEPEDWFVLDGYHFTTDYQKAIYEAGVNLLVIDDMNHLSSYVADIILNQNSHAQHLMYNCDKSTTLLKGTSYMFLRREFLKYRIVNRVIPRLAKKILVSLGGSDPDNVTLKIIESIQHMNEKGLVTNVVVGPASKHKERLRSVLESSGQAFHMLINPPNMVDLMADADLAISAGGGTYWELAYMGVPCIMFILAENQRCGAEELARSGAVMNLGWPNLLSCNDIAMAINSMIISKNKREEMSKKGQAMIDGNGASLTINAMKAYKRSDRILQ